MTKKRITDLDDIAEQITDLGTMIAEQFQGLEDRLTKRMDKLESRMDSLENRMTAQEVAQRETNVRLTRIEGTLEAGESDIKELYEMVSKLRRDFDRMAVKDKALEARIERLETFTQTVAKKYGVTLQ